MTAMSALTQHQYATSRKPATQPRMRDKLGICQWFHYETHEQVEMAVDLLHELGITHLRTGVSWADYHRPGGKAWYDWKMAKLEAFDVLLSVWHTPPSLAEGGMCSAPPRRLQDYSDFIEQLIEQYGQYFSCIELWNEPNNHYKWDFIEHDPQWRKFGQMVSMAGHAARRRGWPTVLGGMIPVDHHWLKLMERYGALDAVDVVAIHGFPEMWWQGDICWEWQSHWHGWDQKIDYISAHTKGKPVWVTETGLATLDFPKLEPARFDLQSRMLQKAAHAPTDRVYWYSLIDLPPEREAIEGYHVDENEYHLGLVTYDGVRKPGFETFRKLLS